MQRKQALILFWVCCILLAWPLTLLDSYASHTIIYSIAAGIVADLLAWNWLLCDAKKCQIKLSWRMQLGAILLFFISYPYYILRYKGIRKSLSSFGLFIGLTVIALGIIYILFLASIILLIAIHGV
jgi:hypothetical protein